MFVTEDLKIFGSSNDLASGFAKFLSEKFSEILNVKPLINIAISGGNTPNLLFKALSTEYKENINWEKINFYWVDERCVPPGSPDSNFGNAYNFLFWKVKLSPANIYRIKGEDTPEEEAERYSFLVKNNIPEKNGMPCFDIILLGIGQDGHTASIFPGQLALFDSDKTYEVSVSPYTQQQRITMTGKVINNAENIYIMISGKQKSAVVNNILNKTDDAARYPASRVAPVNGDMKVFLDKDAAEI